MFKIITEKYKWDKLLEKLDRPSPFCSYNYVHNTAEHVTGGSAELAVAQFDDDILIHPYIKREVDFCRGVFDLTSPYEFGGVWANTNDKQKLSQLFNEFQRNFENHCKKENICCGFVRHYPFCNIQYLKGYDRVLISNNPVFKMNRDLNIFEAMPYSLKKSIRKSKREGVRITCETNMDLFKTIYYKNLKRLKANSFYYFNLSFLNGLRPFVIQFNSFVNNNVVGSHLYLLEKDRMLAFLCHGDHDYQQYRINDLLYYQALNWARENKITQVYFGGGHESLRRYKSKFSNDSIPYYIFKRIFNRSLYNDLVKKKFSHNIAGIDMNFFPLYRYGE